ncbi:MAG: hypothetical protein CSB47_01350 [Proteobacteria bacterium]|nr:MAG: hypothetical protein CSB47_01350 [Pseudomonadota bacterium]
MTVEEKIARIFNLTGDNWLRHANPWSVWTRFATLPFLVLAIWSRTWIGWYSLLPIAVLIIWLIINPIVFKKPKHFQSWIAKSVLGEKYWSERKKKPVPKHHRLIIHILTAIQSLGGIALIIGLWKLDIDLTILGMVVVYLSKMWFLDRMVWIFTERE